MLFLDEGEVEERVVRVVDEGNGEDKENNHYDGKNNSHGNACLAEEVGDDGGGDNSEEDEWPDADFVAENFRDGLFGFFELGDGFAKVALADYHGR